MPWIRFERDFPWSPPELKGLVTTAYKAGTTKLVTTPCADLAEKTGAGRRASNPKRKRANYGEDAGGEAEGQGEVGQEVNLD